MAKVAMLTTEDNPYDPFDQFEQWHAYDLAQGYDTCGYIARIAKTSDDLSEADQEQALDEAIEEILELNVLGIYKKMEKDI